MKTLNRRTFLKGSLLTAASASLAPVFTGCATSQPAARAVRANEDIRVAVVGFNGRGADHIRSLMKLREGGEKVRIVALCDVDSKVLGAAVASLTDKGNPVTGYADVRKLLENPEVDALSIATPNHWHSLGAIWAVQAGRDVYVEKPVSHNVWEGRQLVEAARKYGRIVQAGTQSRSSQGIREAVAWVRAGNLGKIVLARGMCYKRRASIGKVSGPQPIPSNIDYDLWCGPAPKGPLMRKNLHYDWHWVWATGCGDIGNQGIHQMDISRWFLGEPALSPHVLSVGGRLGYVDDGETPNTQVIFHDYPKAPLMFEVRGLPDKTGSGKMDKYMGGSICVIIHCEGGHVLVPDYNGAIMFDRQDKEIRRFMGAEDHHANFLKAVRSRKVSDLTADILEGHLSSALCHTGNISHRLGAFKSPAEIREAIRGEPDAENSFQRMLDHLQANDVDVNVTPLTLGVPLKMNPTREVFFGNARANEMLTRHYRAPFVVPAKV
ncbi:MAG: Gfo/Idh/MocA family oxidoreductase [Verrucomicrobiota bacterium]|jgi:predicted dehydrogenase